MKYNAIRTGTGIIKSGGSTTYYLEIVENDADGNLKGTNRFITITTDESNDSFKPLERVTVEIEDEPNKFYKF